MASIVARNWEHRGAPGALLEVVFEARPIGTAHRALEVVGDDLHHLPARQILTAQPAHEEAISISRSRAARTLARARCNSTR